MTPGDDILLSVRGLRTYFPIRGGLLGSKKFVRAVDGVDLDIPRGATLGLVGESGSGKTTVGRSILRLVHANAGKVIFDGVDVLSLAPGRMRDMRCRMQMIFQDPFGSLNPRMTVGDIVAEPLAVHRVVRRPERRMRTAQLLDRVGLSPAYMQRYPHEFSGGQRQRIGIARALAAQPAFIICDEPVSALDVSIQAQILNLLKDLQDELGLTYLFIAHNLAVVEHFCDRIAVMYLGKIVETAPRDALYNNPRHPYTQALLAAAPSCTPGDGGGNCKRLEGETPSPVNPPSGCAFHPRCPLTRVGNELAPLGVDERCSKITPQLAALADDPLHAHSCILSRD
ncbi:MAG: ATP-binding cassette domain-containing protein [Planctomycetes bacterium]|jgi:oligopeptide transport system ATP-binding protein|nr:ATP-binding cassette domain-containing protein [Planctomycetota bacterium]